MGQEDGGDIKAYSGTWVVKSQHLKSTLTMTTHFPQLDWCKC